MTVCAQCTVLKDIMLNLDTALEEEPRSFRWKAAHWCLKPKKKKKKERKKIVGVEMLLSSVLGTPLEGARDRLPTEPAYLNGDEMI